MADKDWTNRDIIEKLKNSNVKELGEEIFQLSQIKTLKAWTALIKRRELTYFKTLQKISKSKNDEKRNITVIKELDNFLDDKNRFTPLRGLVKLKKNIF